VAKAQLNWPDIKLYGFAFMSNHFHLMLSGESREVSTFVGFIKRELSRRLGQKHKLSGPLWHSRFVSTALPTFESQEECLSYILGQGVKEDLVEHPCQWPGLHCARALLHHQPITGSWFDGTLYGKAKHNRERNESHPPVKKSEFYLELTIKMTPIPPWQQMNKEAQEERAAALVQALMDEATVRRQKSGIKPAGRKKVIRMAISRCVAPPTPPWWEKRRRQITAWARIGDALTQEYLRCYWLFQQAFQAASRCLRRFEEVDFPEGSWLPSHYK
jgi:REP element-mobilizing transposase RayT